VSVDWARVIGEAIEAGDASQIEVLMAPKEPRDVYLSPSALGKCPRVRPGTRAHGVPGDAPGPRSLRVFRYGDFMEALFLAAPPARRRCGRAGPARRRPAAARLGRRDGRPRLDRRRARVRLPDGTVVRCLMDCKTTTAYGFEKHERGYDPAAPFDRGYLYQVTCYHVGRAMATGAYTDAVGILEINKETAEYRFHDLTETVERMIPEVMAAIATAQSPDCPPRQPLKESSAKKPTPPKIDIPCVWGKGSCEYAQRCWGTRSPGPRGSCGSCGAAIDATEIRQMPGPDAPICQRCEGAAWEALSA
jgi:hypothetical protein